MRIEPVGIEIPPHILISQAEIDAVGIPEPEREPHTGIDKSEKRHAAPRTVHSPDVERKVRCHLSRRQFGFQPGEKVGTGKQIADGRIQSESEPDRKDFRQMVADCIRPAAHPQEKGWS